MLWQLLHDLWWLEILQFHSFIPTFAKMPSLTVIIAIITVIITIVIVDLVAIARVVAAIVRVTTIAKAAIIELA